MDVGEERPESMARQEGEEEEGWSVGVRGTCWRNAMVGKRYPGPGRCNVAEGEASPKGLSSTMPVQGWKNSIIGARELIVIEGMRKKKNRVQFKLVIYQKGTAEKWILFLNIHSKSLLF